MDGQVVGSADNDELLCAFKKVKVPPLNFGHQGAAPDFAFHITDRAAHNSAGARGLGGKHLVQPGRVAGWRSQGLKLQNPHSTISA